MTQCQICGRSGWFSNDVCLTCIPVVEERLKELLMILRKKTRLVRTTKGLKKRITYCNDIIDIGSRVTLLSMVTRPADVKDNKEIVNEHVKLKNDLEWEMVRMTADKLMDKARMSITPRCRTNYAKKVLSSLRRLKASPDHMKNEALSDYIVSAEQFIRDEKARRKRRGRS